VLYGIALVSGIMGSLLESIDYNISLLLIPLLLMVLTLLTAYLARIKVVNTPTTPDQGGTISRLMIGLTGRGRILEIALDLVIISISYYLAFWLYYGPNADIISMEIFLRSLPIAIVSAYISFFILGIYRGVWQYISIRDLLRLLWAVLGCGIVLGISLYFVSPFAGVSPNILLLFCTFLFFGLAASRSSFRVLDQFYNQQTRTSEKNAAVIIYGADDAGVMALQLLSKNLGTKYDVVGFVDNDPFKQGRRIQGVNVIGNLDNFEDIIEKYDFQGLIIPSDEMYVNLRNSSALKICRERKIWLKQLRVRFDPVE
jgi:FlaA1/EpsC-like NDP-sugar epimerase